MIPFECLPNVFDNGWLTICHNGCSFTLFMKGLANVYGE